ncbi:hypothetical protein ACFWSF_15520 [Streptomyces sp. NPDC058611]
MPTIKFYLREGLLPTGKLSSPNRRITANGTSAE